MHDWTERHRKNWPSRQVGDGWRERGCSEMQPVLFDVCSINHTLSDVPLLGLIAVQLGLYLSLSYVVCCVMFEIDCSLTSEENLEAEAKINTTAFFQNLRYFPAIVGLLATTRPRSIASRALRHSTVTTCSSVQFNIRSCDTITSKCRLKTFLFNQAFAI